MNSPETGLDRDNSLEAGPAGQATKPVMTTEVRISKYQPKKHLQAYQDIISRCFYYRYRYALGYVKRL